MPATKAEQKAVAKYKLKTYDRLEISVKKGQKDKIKTHAEGMGESLNGFVNRAIDNQIERDNGATDNE
jgi:hypothetical protein